MPCSHNGDSAQYYGLTFWTPNINIFRDPRWGRGQETYGEDTFLTARLGVAFIRGLQGDDPKYIKAMACAKHFAVHSGPEPERHAFRRRPAGARFLRNLSAAFRSRRPRRPRRRGHGRLQRAFMASRPARTRCCSSDLLRKQWGFNGHVVSDCGAIYDIFANHKFVAHARGGRRAARSRPATIFAAATITTPLTARCKGLITEKEIDIALGRMLDRAVPARACLIRPDKVPYAQIPISENDSPEHQALALQVARESMVLLKNNGLLPLDRAKIKHIAVIGANATSVDMLLGNYNGTPSLRSPFSTESRASPARTSKSFTRRAARSRCARDGANKPGRAECWPMPSPPRNRRTSSFTSAASTRSSKARRTRARGFDGFISGDRTHIELPPVQEDLLKALQATGKPVIFVNCSGSAIAMPWEAEHLPAILQAWYPGEQGGRAVAGVLFGDVIPPAGCR